MKSIIFALLLSLSFLSLADEDGLQIKTSCIKGYVFVIIKQEGKYVEVVDIEQILEEGGGISKAPQPMRCKKDEKHSSTNVQTEVKLCANGLGVHRGRFIL